MKKNLFSKVLLALLIVILAFSFAACKKTVNDDDENGDDKPIEEVSDIVTMEDIATMLNDLQPLTQEIDGIEDEFHVDTYFLVAINDDTYRLNIQCNIYENDFNNNQVLLEVRELGGMSADKILFGIYLKQNVLYLNQSVTATEELHQVKFSKLDALEISQLLSKLPGIIKDQELDLTGKIADLATKFAEGEMEAIEIIIDSTEILEFFDEEDYYEIKLISENLGEVVRQIMGIFGSKDPNEPAFGEYQGLVDFISNILFGVDVDKVSQAEDFPELSIRANKTADNGINGLEIVYVSIPNSENGGKKDSINIEIKADVFNSKAITVNFPNLASFKEGALKVAVNIDLPLKGLSLKGDILVDPDFRITEGNNPRGYVSEMFLYDGNNDESFAVDAIYDGKVLLFDLGSFYELLGADNIPTVTTYGVDFDLLQVIEDARNKEPEAEEPEGEESEEDNGIISSLPFEFAENWLGLLLGRVDLFVDIFSDAIDSGSLGLSLDYLIKPLFDGVLVKPDGVDEDGEPVFAKYVKEDMVIDINNALAKYANDYDENEEYTAEQIADFAQSILYEITGADISVEDIIMATGNDSVAVALGLLKEALGFELLLDIAKDNVLTLSIEIDIVDADDFEYPTDIFDGLEAGVDYIDLYSEFDAEHPELYYNIYYEGEGEDAVKKYVILDELLNLLDAYRAYVGQVEA